MKKIFCLFCFITLLISCSKDDPGTNPPPPDNNPEEENPSENPPEENPFIHTEGTQLLDSEDNPIYLKGVAFTNWIYDDAPVPNSQHHGEIDYQRVKDMGMNTVRFYMNYRFFEDDVNPYNYKQSGWDWLDQNIAWAKKYGVYLVLNMHAPQGGYQSQGNGDALWDNVENQNRLVALWKAIAEKYNNEVQIAGFGPVNEPVPSSSMSQWSNLAQRLIDEIREVNENHLIFIERALYVKNSSQPAGNLNFPQVSGSGIVYEFHQYDPHVYTHQLLDFAQLGDGGKYPDETILETTGGQWYTATLSNPDFTTGTSDWTFYEGVKYKIDDTDIKYAVPALVGANVNGTVYFDQIVIKEYDENGNFTKDILTKDLSDASGWNYWSANDSGNSGLTNTDGYDSSSSLFIENATDDCNLTGSGFAFIPQQNYSYQISGWMKGENIDTEAACKLRLDFYTSDGPVYARNKQYLEAVMGEFINWAEANNSVLYMGEFGAGTPCFENDKGGLQYVEDLVTIAKENDVHFTYHAYHEDAFGIYYGHGSLPDDVNANQPLIDVFKNLLD